MSDQRRVEHLIERLRRMGWTVSLRMSDGDYLAEAWGRAGSNGSARPRGFGESRIEALENLLRAVSLLYEWQRDHHSRRVNEAA